jgi:hypothetical protein
MINKKVIKYTSKTGHFSHLKQSDQSKWISKYIKITTFWYSVLHTLVEIDQRFTGAYCLHEWGGDGHMHL